MGLIRFITWPIRTAVKVGTVALVFGVVYNAGYKHAQDPIYSIKRIDQEVYLMDKRSGSMYAIHEGCYVGSPEHMIQGALKTGKEQARSMLESIIKSYERQQ